MAQNYKSRGEVITLVATGSIRSGSPYRINNFNGVAMISAEAGELFSFQLEGVFEFELANVLAGSPVYITSQNQLTLTSQGNSLFGRAVTSSDANGKFQCRLIQA